MPATSDNIEIDYLREQLEIISGGSPFQLDRMPELSFRWTLPSPRPSKRSPGLRRLAHDDKRFRRLKPR
jgi:hypothetical protein